MTLETRLEQMLVENQVMLRQVTGNPSGYQELAVRVDEAEQRQLDQLTSARDGLMKTLDRIDREQDERLTRLENLIENFVRGSGNGRRHKN